jgi:hypothetical protein
MRSRMRCTKLCALALLTLGSSLGCTFNADPGKSVGMEDSFTLHLFGPETDTIHTPYVAGAKFGISIATTGYTDSETTGWHIVSSDPSVLSVGGAGSGSGSAVAKRPGHAVLSVVDAKGNALDLHPVDVDEPDTVELHAHGLMMAGYSDTQSQITHTGVIAGGTATFLVRYFKGSQELWGNGAVTTSATGEVTAATAQSGFGDASDWVRITGTKMGTGEVSLSVGGSTVATVPVDVVAAENVSSVSLLAQSEANAKEGTLLYVFGRTQDANGADLYGGSFEWTADGVSLQASALNVPSDMVSYTYDSKKSESIGATLGGYSSAVDVHGKNVAVGSSADVGCSVARGAGAGGGGFAGFALVLGGAGLVAVRRRRAGRA